MYDLQKYLKYKAKYLDLKSHKKSQRGGGKVTIRIGVSKSFTLGVLKESDEILYTTAEKLLGGNIEIETSKKIQVLVDLLNDKIIETNFRVESIKFRQISLKFDSSFDDYDAIPQGSNMIVTLKKSPGDFVAEKQLFDGILQGIISSSKSRKQQLFFIYHLSAIIDDDSVEKNIKQAINTNSVQYALEKNLSLTVINIDFAFLSDQKQHTQMNDILGMTLDSKKKFADYEVYEFILPKELPESVQPVVVKHRDFLVQKLGVGWFNILETINFKINKC